MTNDKSYDILALGTPIIDQLVRVDEKFLNCLPGHRGGSLPVDYETFLDLIEKSGHYPIYVTGGSAANTAKGLAWLGHQCAFWGKVGPDELGSQFKQELVERKISPLVLTGKNPTAQVVCLISPDNERTMRSFLGAGLEMKPEELTPELFKGVNLVHIEAYLLDRGSIVKRAMELSKAAGAKISFDLSSFEIVTRYKKEIIDLTSTYVDILFANADETLSLTGLTPERGCNLLKDICNIAVVKIGKEGCWVASHYGKTHHPAFPVEAIDTTGAGDLFASGFLHGHLHQKSLTECARYGSFVASHVIQIIGTEITPDVWAEIKKQLM